MSSAVFVLFSLEVTFTVILSSKVISRLTGNMVVTWLAINVVTIL